jgi:hypothetical protein
VRDTLALKLAARGWWPGTARWAAALWMAWALALAMMAAALFVSVRQWREVQRALSTPALLPATVASTKRTLTAAEDVLDRLHVTDPQAAALKALHLALEGAPGVQLVSADFGVQPGTPARLDRTDITFGLRGPYGAIKQVLGQWSARFETSSLISLRLQPSATVPGVIEATAVAALWTRPSVPSSVDATASAPSPR